MDEESIPQEFKLKRIVYSVYSYFSFYVFFFLFFLYDRQVSTYNMTVQYQIDEIQARVNTNGIKNERQRDGRWYFFGKASYSSWMWLIWSKGARER